MNRSPGLAAVAVGLMLLVGADSALGAGSKTGTKLVAVAPGGGTGPAVRVTYDVDRGIMSLVEELRVVRQPAPDTVVLEGPRRAPDRRGRYVVIKPCTRIRLHVAIVPDPVDPFTLVTTLIPDADEMGYETHTGSAEVLGATSRPPTMWMDRRHDAPWKVGATTTAFSLVDWAHGGVFGFETITAEGTILRLGGTCRARTFSVVPPDLTSTMLPGRLSR